MTPDLILMLLAGAGILTIGALADSGDSSDDDAAAVKIEGTEQADVLHASSAFEGEVPAEPVTVIVDGGGGDDTIYGSLHNSPLGRPDMELVELRGGAGNDLIHSLGVTVPTIADGGTGDDTLGGLTRSWSPETLRGGDGDDWLSGAGDTLEGGAGDDYLLAEVMSPAVTTPPLDPDNPQDSTYDPNLDDTPTVMTGGEGHDVFTLSSAHWMERYDDVDPASRPGPQMNDVTITDFDPANDLLTLPLNVGAFHSAQWLYPDPGDILNRTAAFESVTAEATPDGLGTVLTVTYLPAQEAGLEPLVARITLENVQNFNPDLVTFRDGAR